jgi:nucleotide-binding universal stress UspA family protein
MWQHVPPLSDDQGTDWEETMFQPIIAPVDLAHKEGLRAALDCACDLARHSGAKLTFAGVTSTMPGSVARTPEEYLEKLKAFAQAEGETHRIETGHHSVVSHDPAVEIDEAILRAVGETEADLVVMASHIPGALDYVWPSNGGKVAAHAKCSVMLVRS